MKLNHIIAALSMVLLPSLASASGNHADGHGEADTIGQPGKAENIRDKSAKMTEGEIRKIDKANKKITIKHGEIKNLEMPGMTMVFQVKDPVMLDKVKAGDKVKFRAEKAGSALVVTDIEPSK